MPQRTRAKYFLMSLMFGLVVLASPRAARCQFGCCSGFDGYQWQCHKSNPYCEQSVLVMHCRNPYAFAGVYTIDGYVTCCGSFIPTQYPGPGCSITAPVQAKTVASADLRRTFYVRDCRGKYVLISLPSET